MIGLCHTYSGSCKSAPAIGFPVKIANPMKKHSRPMRLPTSRVSLEKLAPTGAMMDITMNEVS